jgi:hypothetical protein
LNRVAASLPKAKGIRTRETLVSFSAPGISTHSISSSLSAVQSLVDGMMVTCAKRRARPVLELVASESPSPDLVLADLVLAEGPVVLGRVVYGSFEILAHVLKITGNLIPLFLDDKDGGAWAGEWPAEVSETIDADRILPIRSKRLFESYVEEVLLTAAQRTSDFCLMIYGSPAENLLKQCCQNFRNVVVHGALPPAVPSNCWQMNDFTDRMHFDLGIGVALLLCPPDAAESAAIDQLLAPEGIVITSGHFPRFENEIVGRPVLRLDSNQAYRGQLDRWIAICNLMKAAQPISVAAQ